MGDADESYDFGDIKQFINKLDMGYDLVMGNRFAGGIEHGAMSWSHRYIGNPILSGIGRIFYKTKIGDFHCGLRAFRKDSIESLKLHTTGMEFASEMVVKSVLFNLKITEVPCKLYPDGRDRPPHLRSIPDGLRHLLFLLIYSPKWLFLYPGLLFCSIGTILMLILFVKPLYVLDIRLDIITMFYSAIGIMVGLQTVMFSIFTNVYGRKIGQLPDTMELTQNIERFMEKKGFILSGIMIIFVLMGVILTLVIWGNTGFGELTDSAIHRQAIFFGTLLTTGIQILLSCFFINVLHMGGDE